MPVFAVIRQTSKAGALEGAIRKEFAEASYDLGHGTWLVAGSGTAHDISDKLGITPDAVSGTGIVIEAASYYGRANPAVWTWIKENWERKSDG